MRRGWRRGIRGGIKGRKNKPQNEESHSTFSSHLVAPAPTSGVMWASNEVRAARCVTTSSVLLLLFSLPIPLVSALGVDDKGLEDNDDDEEEVEATRRAKGRRRVASSTTCPARH